VGLSNEILGSGCPRVRTRLVHTVSENEASTFLARNCDGRFNRTEFMRPIRIFHANSSPLISRHLMSRALDRTMIVDDIAKEKFREFLAQQCVFSQIGVARCRANCVLITSLL